MSYHCWFECIRGCGRRYSIYDVVYRCEDCGGLLDVEHDLEALKDRSPAEWKQLFEQRTRTNQWPYGSGVWGKKEWVCPQVENENVVSMYEGHTNCFWAERLGKEIGVPDLWVKLCGNSHTGSFKDLGMTVLVSVVKQMMADGKPIRAVACASTGDTSAALAAYAAAAGIPAVILLPRGKVSTAQLVQPIANGALVLALDTDFDGCMRIVQELTTDPTIYLANSMNSLRMEGQKTVGIEIVQQFDWEVPDWIIIPVGNLGNVSALGKGLLMMRELGLIDKLPRIACAQAERANPLYLSYLTGFQEYRPVKAQKTLASAIQIGDPVSYERAVKVLRAFEGIVEQASEDELANAAARADRTGMYCCPHTGVALAVLFKLVERGQIKPSDRVVVISTAHGLKFTNFKVGYHDQNLDEVISRHANPPLELRADYSAVSEAINRAFGY
ncbi:MAG: threonine synthase [Anaerolineae bacterium]|jgi:threonine synthase|nr:threonine synthase [Anaerolineae bacterium]MDH7473763.1 threonine synthase [Anaerolineae bacterium]